MVKLLSMAAPDGEFEKFQPPSSLEMPEVDECGDTNLLKLEQGEC